ncbi:MAG: class I SAM-dependent methyltransferase [Bacteroidales bacterium]|jgi:SAM-dependent methyltransferase|nr:class I SAM-dependent methyltransferase [Bacteroidales bacterium]
MINYSSCPVCSSAGIRLHVNCHDYFKTGELFPVWKCQACGIGFTQNRPDDGRLGYYYESDNYISHGATSGGIVNRIYRIVRNCLLNRKRNIIRHESGLAAGSLLDIGSGTGHLAAKMKKAGWNVKGVEINDRAREFAVLQHGLETLAPSEMQHLREAEYDCITLWHVLEHLSDLDGYISQIRRLLKPGGVCIVAVPNISSCDAKHYGEHWAAYDTPRHLWHFNSGALGFLFESRNFKLIKVKQLPVDVFYISILSERYRKNPFAFFAGLLKGVFFTAKTLFNKKGCSSLIYVFKLKRS